MKDKERSQIIFQTLKKEYGPIESPLAHKTPEQLAIAVILSAQCTDRQVNEVTPHLFKEYPTMKDLSLAKQKDVEEIIFSTGFYHNKAKHIIALAKETCELYDGKIPDDFEALLKLPGIGRKSANVIMNLSFGKAPGIVVDTHVKRITYRMGFTDNRDPVKIERDLMAVWPKSTWIDFSTYLIFLGRSYCSARKKNCKNCFVSNHCPKRDLPG